jgi:hypothetical protein
MTLIDSLHGCQVRQCLLPYVCFIKGKAIPLQAWTGHRGVRRLRLPDFKTIKFVAPPRKIFLVLISVRGGWKDYVNEKITPSRIEPATFRFV